MRNKGTIDGGSTEGPSAAKIGGSGRDGGSDSPPTRSPSSWKEEELLLKIDGEIKARNPNLEVRRSCESLHSTIPGLVLLCAPNARILGGLGKPVPFEAQCFSFHASSCGLGVSGTVVGEREVK